MAETLSRAEVARLAGVSPDTLRHYERKGVLPSPPRSANGYRRYGPEAVARVQVIQRALAAGFTLDELARVWRERAAGGAPCRKVRALVAARLQALDDELAALTTLRDELRTLLQAWDARLAAMPPGRQARLLEAWPGPPQTARAARGWFRRPRAMREK